MLKHHFSQILGADVKYSRGLDKTHVHQRGGETNFKGSGACDPGEVWGGPAVRSMLRHPKVKALIYSSLQLLHEERGIALSRPLQISQPIHSWDYCLIHLPFTGCL